MCASNHMFILVIFLNIYSHLADYQIGIWITNCMLLGIGMAQVGIIIFGD